jgi:hypothetical protein
MKDSLRAGDPYDYFMGRWSVLKILFMNDCQYSLMGRYPYQQVLWQLKEK